MTCPVNDALIMGLGSIWEYAFVAISFAESNKRQTAYTRTAIFFIRINMFSSKKTQVPTPIEYLFYYFLPRTLSLFDRISRVVSVSCSFSILGAVTCIIKAARLIVDLPAQVIAQLSIAFVSVFNECGIR